MCVSQRFIKTTHGERHRPIGVLFRARSDCGFGFDPWLIQGIADEKDLGSAMTLRISAYMSFEHLVGHTGDHCESIDCKGGPTCDEKMWLFPRSKGHLFSFIKLIQEKGSDHGAYGICWHMGRALLNVLPAPVRQKIGFMHPALQRTTPRSIWTSLYGDFWEEMLIGKDPQKVRDDFLSRITDGLREVQSEALAKHEKIGGVEGDECDGFESWSDEEM
jgi:hypothetical protein